MGNGLIFAFVVALWAAYFVPLAVRRYDEASKSGSIEHFSSLSRVIPHKKQVVEEEVVMAPEPEIARPTIAKTLDRPAARLAARRRRRTLLTLLTLAVIVTTVAALALVPLWTIVIPSALILAWLVACRIQVRGELGIARKPHAARNAKRNAKKDAKKADKHDDGEDTIIVSGQFEDIDPHRKHSMEKVELETDALDEKIEIAVPVGTIAGAATWYPLPVTLPTYVTKPRAGRTVRTIEFGEPGAWTSGHIEGEDVELPSRKDAGEDDQRRAVGN